AWAKDLDGLGITCNAILPGGAVDTAIIPLGFRRTYSGPYLPISVMNEALLWLLSDASGGVNGRRIVGALWDASLPPDEAAKKAMPPSPELPVIL
ncbi:MAG: hypothetical protein HYU75_18195, partial [Betaproteobacteria bacterium]|nr:hypothetical protein [Betaproteobacteria bacterium]